MRINNKMRNTVSGYSFILPTTVLFSIFYFYPLIMTFIDGFYNINLMSGDKSFIGFKNYQTIFQNGDFVNAIKNTTIYTVFVVLIGTFVPIVLSVLLNRPIKGKGIYRTLIFLPFVAPTVASSMVFTQLFSNDNTGTVNQFLAWFHVDPIAWLGDPNGIYPMITIIIFGIWMMIGYNMVLFLAGLQNIPHTYYEAARLDGANAWQMFRKITLPLLSQTTLFVIVVSVITAFQVFDQVYMLTAGGPMNETTTVVYYIYNEAFPNFNPGLASAMSTILFIILLVFSIIQIRISNKRRDW